MANVKRFFYGRIGGLPYLFARCSDLLAVLLLNSNIMIENIEHDKEKIVKKTFRPGVHLMQND